MYRNVMELEVKSIEREMTAYNAIAAKERRLFKAITSDEVFKLCNGFLQEKNTNEMVDSGFENEQLWKKALLDKEKQVRSIDNWLKMIKVISVDEHCGDASITNAYNELASLSVPETVINSIEPDDSAYNPSFEDDELLKIDDDVNQSTNLPDRPKMSLASEAIEERLPPSFGDMILGESGINNDEGRKSVHTPVSFPLFTDGNFIENANVPLLIVPDPTQKCENACNDFHREYNRPKRSGKQYGRVFRDVTDVTSKRNARGGNFQYRDAEFPYRENGRRAY